MAEIAGIRKTIQELRDKSPMAAEVLCMGAFLADAPLPTEFALHIEGGMHSPALLNPAAAVFAMAATLDPLLSGGLALSDGELQTFSIPPEVRQAVLELLSAEERLEWAARACYVLNLSLPDAEPGNWYAAEPLMPHVEACFGLVEQGVRSVAANRVLHQAGFFLFQQERFDQAVRYLEAALAVDVDVKGEKHPDIAADHEGLGMVRLAAGDLDGAEREYLACIKLREEIYTQDNPMLAPALDGLAYTLLASGRTAEAVRQWGRAASIMERVSGGEHPFVAACRENIRQYS
ncbi:tetratricopeptide repeat protein [Salidesulfovibrio onnuriiensis]|uniref:tetratricopeptide repeat protein n=1 Tax=Salidesulfovibrio onnuriiensis TaxID=2583823 RepID=UPI00164FA0A5|nr:tetratricopeptide repeat protein [Salidesulfovibrio onnuriiensis]